MGILRALEVYFYAHLYLAKSGTRRMMVCKGRVSEKHTSGVKTPFVIGCRVAGDKSPAYHSRPQVSSCGRSRLTRQASAFTSPRWTPTCTFRRCWKGSSDRNDGWPRAWESWAAKLRAPRRRGRHERMAVWAAGRRKKLPQREDRDHGSEIRKTLVEVRCIPGPKIRTWGTRPDSIPGPQM